MLRIFIGFDERETVAYHALVQSIIKHCSEPFSVTPLVRRTLPVREKRDAKASTDFADTRFLVPSLCDYEGWAMFMDCDMLFTANPKILWDARDDKYAVMVRKHNYNPEQERKFLNQVQTRYKMKNWSSLMIFNNQKCKALSPAYVNSSPGLDLHQFKWLKNEGEIGCLPEGWNHLVNHDYSKETPPLLHYTEGGPYFNEYRYCPYSREWWDMYREMIRCEQR